MARSQGLNDTTEKDRRMIVTPMDWPRWPILPLTRRNGKVFSDPDYCGFILAVEAPPYTVYVASIFEIIGSATASRGLSTKQYASVDALVQDWKVD